MKVNDILFEKNATKKKKGNKRKKNGFNIMSLDQFVDDALTEAPLGLNAPTSRFPDDELKAYLKRVKGGSKEKRDRYKFPYIHGSNIDIKDSSGEDYDLDRLRDDIMVRPKKILRGNEKMQHSDGSKEQFFNVGLPALKGLAVDESTGDFVIVNTCPGAGECKLFCYALKGSYVMFPRPNMFQTRVLNFLLNDPEGFEAKLTSEIAKEYKKYSKKDTKLSIRWHDAGDFFSAEYMDMAFNIARKFPEVSFYAYTKVAGRMGGDRPDNFKMNFSQGALSKEEKQIDFSEVKHSKVVPKDMFYDLIARDGRKLIRDSKGRVQFENEDTLNEFKKRVAKFYDIDFRTILTYDEMMKKKDLGEKPKWNVIVMPGDGDNSANNSGVLGTYLLFH